MSNWVTRSEWICQGDNPTHKEALGQVQWFLYKASLSGAPVTREELIRLFEENELRMAEERAEDG